MKEIKNILTAAARAEAAGIRVALATVVHVEGSAYRRPGARMLVTETGEITGAISGGCLEGDALRKAQLVLKQQQNMLVTYDTMDEDDAKLGVGLGCNGIIHVLIEPVIYNDPGNPVALLKMLVADRGAAVLVCIFSLANKKDRQPGTCFLQKINRGSIISTRENKLTGELINDIAAAFNQKSSAVNDYQTGSKQITAFIEYVEPVLQLVIAGAGNDVIPLTEMAAVIGWETIVVDGRPSYATSGRFKQAGRVQVSKPEQALDNICIDSNTYFLLMTHNYNYDLAVLKILLKHQVSYIGLLGPKKKWLSMQQELMEGGLILTKEQLDAMHSPVGLDIGAETPEEIALSIVAEIKAVMSGRNGLQLREKVTAIHQDHHRSLQKI